MVCFVLTEGLKLWSQRWTHWVLAFLMSIKWLNSFLDQTTATKSRSTRHRTNLIRGRVTNAKSRSTTPRVIAHDKTTTKKRLTTHDPSQHKHTKLKLNIQIHTNMASCFSFFILLCRWSDFQSLATQRKQALESALNIQNYNLECNEIKSWMKEKTKVIESTQSLGNDLAGVMALQRKLTGMERDLEAIQVKRKASLRLIRNKVIVALAFLLLILFCFLLHRVSWMTCILRLRSWHLSTPSRKRRSRVDWLKSRRCGMSCEPPWNGARSLWAKPLSFKASLEILMTSRPGCLVHRPPWHPRTHLHLWRKQSVCWHSMRP